MLNRNLKAVVTPTLLSLMAGCASTQSVDMSRFSEGRKLLSQFQQAQQSCSVVPSTLHQVDLPTDTSGGVFKTLADVGKQDAAVASHYPILANRFTLLSDTVKSNERDDAANATDTKLAIEQLKAVFDDVIKDEEPHGFWPFK